jgi:hypothetical protein
MKAAIETWSSQPVESEQSKAITRTSSIDIQQLLMGKPVPIIIIDEFAVSLKGAPPSDPDILHREFQTRFMLNIFRSLGFVLITAGTNSRAANLIGAVKFSGRDGSNLPWCYIVGDLPRFRLEACALDSNHLSPKLTEILMNSRPFFAQVACQYILEHCDLDYCDEQLLVHIVDSISAEVADAAKTRKCLFSHEWGALGQFSIFKNISYERNHVLPSDLINYHYASLISPSDSSNNFVLDRRGFVCSQVWNACSRYSKPEEDVLLHLSLPGCKSFCPFQSQDGKDESFLDFFLKWKKGDEFRKRLLNWSENVAQTGNDGMSLEDCASVCICASSRANGVSGAPVSTFLRVLSFHVYGIEWDCMKEFTSGGHLSCLSENTIPFLSTANQKWREILGKIPGNNFGHLTRTQNWDKVDLRGTPFSKGKDAISFSVECKDWEYKIDVATLENKLVPNIPSSSKLHVVFTRQLQKEYYTSRKMKGHLTYHQAFGTDLRARGMIFLKLEDTQEGSMRFQEINGLPSKSESPTCVVLFLLCPSLLIPRIVPFEETELNDVNQEYEKKAEIN